MSHHDLDWLVDERPVSPLPDADATAACPRGTRGPRRRRRARRAERAASTIDRTRPVTPRRRIRTWRVAVGAAATVVVVAALAVGGGWFTTSTPEAGATPLQALVVKVKAQHRAGGRRDVDRAAPGVSRRERDRRLRSLPRRRDVRLRRYPRRASGGHRRSGPAGGSQVGHAAQGRCRRRVEAPDRPGAPRHVDRQPRSERARVDAGGGERQVGGARGEEASGHRDHRHDHAAHDSRAARERIDLEQLDGCDECRRRSAPGPGRRAAAVGHDPERVGQAHHHRRVGPRSSSGRRFRMDTSNSWSSMRTRGFRFSSSAVTRARRRGSS